MWPGRGRLTSRDDVLEQRHQIGRPPAGANGARLTEDVDPSAHLAQGLHDLDGILLVIEPEARERERDHESRLEIERVRSRDGAIQRVTRGRPQRVEEERAAVRREHGRAPARRRYRLEGARRRASGK